jgi:hypothetical protein
MGRSRPIMPLMPWTVYLGFRSTNPPAIRTKSSYPEMGDRAMTFKRRVFLTPRLYGAIVIAPRFFLETSVTTAVSHPEQYEY